MMVTDFESDDDSQVIMKVRDSNSNREWRKEKMTEIVTVYEKKTDSKIDSDSKRYRGSDRHWQPMTLIMTRKETMTVTLTDTITITNCDCEKDGHNELIYIKNDKEVTRTETVVKIVAVTVRVKNTEASNTDS